ncbi:hypothetical protein FJZ53_01015 [Candidatus Woesearchaeota archaeon]|nr:hypothetical protein [Candidatus Woesearchaeota archaeon]
MIIKLLGLIAIGIAVLIAGYTFFRKTPEKYYRKAKVCHKKGEEYYNLGDPELAKDYYDEAEYYREQAEAAKNSL